MIKTNKSLILLYPSDQTLSDISLPDGYILRNYNNDDKDQYNKLLELEGWNLNDEGFKVFYDAVLPNGIFIIEDEGTGQIVSTAAAIHNPNCSHHYFPFGGEVGFVITRPEHRGKAIGTFITSISVKRLISGGYFSIRAVTHDHRLSAIKTYLNIGFQPFIYQEDMESRWNEVIKQLNLYNKHVNYINKGDFEG
ncbi:GNAT family N-acetyltransferase [Paenibacillus sp. KQZ6P-2]|uniref:GNAT family N-acetyltransferase n=1 Tax=Paenibacillus mangrovi TaxID=2931978 RepID=A0A9X2B466_9BACL|nr:GNAT family N-acetyltransferase [Paenibacillus mangrovi]MCJ8010758.1 GNAT family N-acetyltransferase [Paenibacillus mangrovi]